MRSLVAGGRPTSGDGTRGPLPFGRQMAVISEALRGRRIGITGATGFLGTALAERILRHVPDAEVVLLVRPGRRTSAAERVRREIVRNDAFDRLREELGDRFAAELERRLRVVGGDVGV